MPPSIDIFFYGLFMDEDLLRGKGLTPMNSRPARLDGFGLRIGKRATVVAAKDECGRETSLDPIWNRTDGLRARVRDAKDGAAPCGGGGGDEQGRLFDRRGAGFRPVIHEPVDPPSNGSPGAIEMSADSVERE